MSNLPYDGYDTWEDMIKGIAENRKWYFHLVPICCRLKTLRLFHFCLYDHSYTACNAIRFITKKHCIDYLRTNNRKWWQLPICGFQVWY